MTNAASTGAPSPPVAGRPLPLDVGVLYSGMTVGFATLVVAALPSRASKGGVASTVRLVFVKNRSRASLGPAIEKAATSS